MAKVIIEDQQVVSRTWYTWGRTIAVGAVAGLAYWVLTVLIGQYIVEPLVCRNIVDATACTNATPLAGNIAAILVAVLSIIGMVRMGIARPIIIAIASAALLWNLGAWTQGLFWLESIVWSVALYALVFALFAWITRAISLWITIIISLLIVLIIRIALIL